MAAADCRSLGFNPKFYNQTALAEQEITLTSDQLRINGEIVGGVMLRMNPLVPCSENYIEDDRRFCDAEVFAIAAALREVSGLVSINGLSAPAWFANPGWEYYYQIFKICGANWAEFDLDQKSGSSWIPFMFGLGTEKKSLTVKNPSFPIAWKNNEQLRTLNIAFGQTIGKDGEVQALPDPVMAKALETAGIDICQLDIDQDNNPVSLSLFPEAQEIAVVEKIAKLSSGHFKSSLERVGRE